MAHDPGDRPTAAEFRDRLSALTLAAPSTNGSAAPAANGSAVIGKVAAATSADDKQTDEPTTSATGAAVEDPTLDTEFAPGPAAGAAGGDKPPPEQLVEDPTEDRRRSHRVGWILAAAVALVLAVSLIVA